MKVAAPGGEVQTLADLLRDGLFTDGDWVESKDQDPLGEVRLIQLADVGDGVFRNRSARFLTMAKAKQLGCTFLEPGDVLVARMPDPLGRACIFPGVGQPAVTAVDVCILRPNPARVNSEWLAGMINSPEFRAAMQMLVRGTTRARISRRNLGTLQLPVPDVAQQKSVAESIERLKSRRDLSARHVLAAGKAIDRFQLSVLAAACSGRLTADWRFAHESSGRELASAIAATATERRRAKSSSHASSGPAEDIPGEWGTCSGALVFPFVTSGSRGWAKYYSDEGPLFLRVGNLDRYTWRLDLSAVQRVNPPRAAEGRRTRVETGDILISITAEIGMVGVVPPGFEEAYVNQHVAIARPNTMMSSEFLAMWLASPAGGEKQLRALERGATKTGLGLDDIRGLMVPIPPIEEQQEIVRRVERLFALAEAAGHRIDTASRSIDRSSQAVLAKAFRGELTTPQEPA